MSVSISLFSCHFQIIDNFDTILWDEEESGVWCPNHVLDRSASSQLGCQNLCKNDGKANCVGIAYSDAPGSNDWCYKCTNDTTEAARSDYGFYRRPSMYHLTLTLILINLTILILIILL